MTAAGLPAGSGDLASSSPVGHALRLGVRAFPREV